MVLILTVVALIIPVIFLVLWMNKPKNDGVLLPPAPKALPIIGNLHQLSFQPFKSLRDLSNRYGPILKLGSAPMVVVSSPEITEQMLKHQDPSFADRPRGVALEIMLYNYSDIGFSPYGEYWRQMRKICIIHLLSPRMVRTFASIRTDEVGRMVDSLRHSCGTVVNLTEKVSSFSSSITCRAAFGKVRRDGEGAAVVKMLLKTLKLGAGFEIADMFPSSRIVNALSWTRVRAKMMRRKLDLILDDIIDEHRRNLAAINGRGDSGSTRLGNSEFGGEDLVDVFLRIKEEEQLQFPIVNDNIKAVLYDIFGAGTESTSSTIDWAMVELMRNPRVMKKVQAEVRQVVFKENESTTTTRLTEDDVHKFKYLKLVIKETLRLHPPAPMLPRASREECQINGYTIPAKVKVMFNVWAMQRDPRYWKDPEKFEPERFENQTVNFIGGHFQFLPFGTGKRVCPGIEFGLTNVELALANLLYNFNWKLPKGVREQDLDMIESLSLAATRKNNLFVIVTPHQSLV